MLSSKHINFIPIPRRITTTTPFDKDRRATRQRISKRLHPTRTSLLKRVLTKLSKFAQKNETVSKTESKSAPIEKTKHDLPSLKAAEVLDHAKRAVNITNQDTKTTSRTSDRKTPKRYRAPKPFPFLSRVAEVLTKYKEDLCIIETKIASMTKLKADPSLIAQEELRMKAHKKMVTIMRGFLGEGS